MQRLIAVAVLSATASVVVLAQGPAPRATTTATWAGFRGATQQGRASGPLPSAWDATHGIAWKTAVPGRGHSSPIVDADRVYVSTAYPETVGVLAARLDAVVALLALLLVMIVTRRAARDAASGSLPTARLLLRTSATIATAIVLFVVAWLGYGLLDFPRCDIRGWLGSAGFVTLAWTLALVDIRSRRDRLLWSAALVAFAMVVGMGVPSRDHAFRGGLLALNSQMVFTTSSMPLSLGLIGAWRTVARPVTWRLPLAALATGVMAAAALVRHLLVFRNDSLLDVSYEPRLGAWVLVAAVIGAAFVLWRVRPKTPGGILGASAMVAGLALVAVVALGEQIAARSNYLAYHIGAPRLQSQLGGMTLFAVACGMLLVHLLATVFATNRPQQPPRVSPRIPALTVCAIALAAVFFVRVNYVHAESRLTRVIVAVDRASGAVEWTSPGLSGPMDTADGRNSPATPTPVADGTHVCAYFGNPGVLCVDREGRQLWARTDVTYSGFYGVGFSPVLADGVLILASDVPAGKALVHAFDVRTGTPIWRREFDTTPAVSGNNRTPIVTVIDGEATVIIWGQGYLKGLALHTGQETWQYRLAPGGDLVSSAVADDARVYLSDVTGTIALDLASLKRGVDPVRWTSPARANCASPVLCGGRLYTITDNGILTGLNASTGAMLWRHRLPGFYFSSLLASPDAIYATNNEGVTTVVACADVFRQLAQNPLDEPVYASLAAGNGFLFLRGGRHLYAIGAPRVAAGSGLP